MTQRSLPWKCAWVTGASSGLGYELAGMLASEAAHVAISARSGDALDTLAAAHGNVSAYALDVSNAQAVGVCVEKIEAAHGPIDLAVLNAGTWQLMKATDFDLKAVRQGVEVNYLGVCNALDAILPGMIARGCGHIAITASISGYRGLPGSLAYAPTKAALINLAEILRLELAPLGITVSLVNPGFVDTPMTRENRFPMPGLMPVKPAASKMLAGLKQRKFEVVFPLGIVMAMKTLRLLPYIGYFWVVRRFLMKK